MNEITIESRSDGQRAILGFMLVILSILSILTGRGWLFLTAFGILVLAGNFQYCCVSYTFSTQQVRKNLQNYSTWTVDEWDRLSAFQKNIAYPHLPPWRSFRVPPQDVWIGMPTQWNCILALRKQKEIRSYSVSEICGIDTVKQLLSSTIVIRMNGCPPPPKTHIGFWKLKYTRKMLRLCVNKKYADENVSTICHLIGIQQPHHHRDM